MIAAPQLAGFDYSKLTPEVESIAFNAASRIRLHVRAIAEAIISIGSELIAVKRALDHGEFGRWLEAEFSWDGRTARRYMAAAEAFKGKTDTVADLAPTTIYALSEPSTPPQISGRDRPSSRRWRAS